MGKQTLPEILEDAQVVRMDRGHLDTLNCDFHDTLIETAVSDWICGEAERTDLKTVQEAVSETHYGALVEIQKERIEELKSQQTAEREAFAKELEYK